MNHRFQNMSPRGRQKGAALVIGLMLLTILTLLSIVGMNTASTELAMAGNEQFRQNAFQAAETGIEQALAMLPSVPPGGVPRVVGTTPVPGSASDNYTTTSTYLGEDVNIPGFSFGKFVGYHYEIVSTGTSSRNAAAVHRQGAFIVQSAGGT